MKSTFGNRLFRLFLLLSIAPALILTLFGFYLTLETGHLLDDRGEQLDTKVTDYYNSLLFDKIEDALVGFPYADTAAVFVDFVMTAHNDQIEIVKSGGYLTPDVSHDIVSNSEDRPHGFITVGDRIF